MISKVKYTTIQADFKDVKSHHLLIRNFPSPLCMDFALFISHFQIIQFRTILVLKTIPV